MHYYVILRKIASSQPCTNWVMLMSNLLINVQGSYILLQSVNFTLIFTYYRELCWLDYLLLWCAWTLYTGEYKHNFRAINHLSTLTIYLLLDMSEIERAIPQNTASYLSLSWQTTVYVTGSVKGVLYPFWLHVLGNP